MRRGRGRKLSWRSSWGSEILGFEVDEMMKNKFNGGIGLIPIESEGREGRKKRRIVSFPPRQVCSTGPPLRFDHLYKSSFKSRPKFIRVAIQSWPHPFGDSAWELYSSVVFHSLLENFFRSLLPTFPPLPFWTKLPHSFCTSSPNQGSKFDVHGYQLWFILMSVWNARIRWDGRRGCEGGVKKQTACRLLDDPLMRILLDRYCWDWRQYFWDNNLNLIHERGGGMELGAWAPASCQSVGSFQSPSRCALLIELIYIPLGFSRWQREVAEIG